MYSPTHKCTFTIVSTVFDRGALVCPCCPVGQSVLAQVEEGHGFEIQLAIWVGFGGHGHAVQEVWQNRVAGSGWTWWRGYLGSSLPWAMAARCHDGGGSAVIDISAGLGFSRQIFCWPEHRDKIKIRKNVLATGSTESLIRISDLLEG